MSETRTVAQVLGDRVKAYREQRGLRQEDLADLTAELGYPLARVTVAKIEAKGTRAENASATEIMVLAAALDVPPIMLLLPIGEDEEVAVTPVLKAHPHLIWQWVNGDEEVTIGGFASSRDPRQWRRNTLPLRMARRLWELQAEARHGGEEELRRLADHIDYMEDAEQAVPALEPDLAERLAKLKGGGDGER